MNRIKRLVRLSGVLGLVEAALRNLWAALRAARAKE